MPSERHGCRSIGIISFKPRFGEAETPKMVRDVTTTLLSAFIGFWVLALGPFCWILRDGLGPNSVDSHGLYAIVRFLMTFYWGPILVLLVVLRLIVGHFVGRRTPDAVEPESPA